MPLKVGRLQTIINKQFAIINVKKVAINQCGNVIINLIHYITSILKSKPAQLKTLIRRGPRRKCNDLHLQRGASWRGGEERGDAEF
ncbi:hypothetical protein SAMN04487911_1471 [Arenibacter nanhaiticus]|uniref:Uncharacterized protein n=1 Tax=Arenibacter nanhaiticus TaxID=558155 RepID=A0A1M6MSF3_9FLAO|nr:hypothetical protein SAMN04487911_1471 [Arenibacter nanhaiticus]